MKKIRVLTLAGVAIAMLGVGAYAVQQYNWGNSLGTSWQTPDDTTVVKNQVLQITATGIPSVSANTNVTLPGTLIVPSSATIQGSLTFTNTTGLTITQLAALTPTTTGQIVFCTNCTNTFLVISTGTGQGAWAGVFAATSTAGGTSSTLAVLPR